MTHDSTSARSLPLGRLVVLAAAAGFTAWFFLQALNPLENSGAGSVQLVGQAPPGFPAEGTWLNAPEDTNFETLRGKVVFLQFSFLACGACRMMDPHLEEWNALSRSRGLAVVEVIDGAIDGLDAVRAWASRDQIPFAIFHDTDGQMTRSYGVRAYPTYFVIDPEGRVAWQGGGYSPDAVSAIEKQLERVLPP